MSVLDFIERNNWLIQRPWDNLCNDGYTGQFCRPNQAYLNGVIGQDIRATMPLLFDSGFMPGDALEQMVAKLVYGTVSLEMEKAKFSPPGDLTRHVQEFSRILNDAKVFIQRNQGSGSNFGAPAGGYNSGYDSRNRMPTTSVFGNNNNGSGNNGVSAFTTNARSSGNGNFSNNSQPTVSFAEGQTMNKEDHLPYHLRNQPMLNETRVEDTQQQEVAVVEPPKRKFYTTNIEIVNKLDTEYDNNGCSVSSLVYMAVPESLSKPILISISEARFFPILNPKDNICERMRNIICDSKNIFELFEKLDGELKRNQIAAAVEWLNKRISHIVEMSLRHRYRLPTAMMPNYKKFYRDFHADMGLHKWYPEFQDMLMTHIGEEVRKLSEVEGSVMVAGRKDIPFIEAVSSTQMLTLPWIIRYNYGKNIGWSEDVSNDELNLVLEKAFAIVDKNICSMLVTDLSNTRFRVYPIAPLPEEGDVGPRFHWEIFAF